MGYKELSLKSGLVPEPTKFYLWCTGFDLEGESSPQRDNFKDAFSPAISDDNNTNSSSSSISY